MDKHYTNSKIECPVCKKSFAKNYMLNHLKRRHGNCYGTEWWDRYSDRYKQIVSDNKKLFGVR